MKKLNIIITGLKSKQPIFAYFDEEDKLRILDTDINAIDDNSISFTIQPPIQIDGQ